MTYEEYRTKSREEFNALPIFWAFSKEQFKEAMEERGLTENDTDKIFRFGTTGGYYLKSDSNKIKAYFSGEDMLPELMNNHEFAVDAFYYEMCDHEYIYDTYQGDWDVCSCFGRCEYSEAKDYKDYLTEMGYKDDTVKAYKEAKQKYYRYCDENDIC